MWTFAFSNDDENWKESAAVEPTIEAAAERAKAWLIVCAENGFPSATVRLLDLGGDRDV